MKAYCTQFTDRECREEDCCLNERKIKFPPENVRKIATEFIHILDKYYPEISKKTFDSYGMPNECGSPSLVRAEVVIYFELLKAGVKFDE